MIEEAGGLIVAPDPLTVVAEGTIVLAGAPGVFERIKTLAEDAFAA